MICPVIVISTPPPTHWLTSVPYGRCYLYPSDDAHYLMRMASGSVYLALIDGLVYFCGTFVLYSVQNIQLLMVLPSLSLLSTVSLRLGCGTLKQLVYIALTGQQTSPICSAGSAWRDNLQDLTWTIHSRLSVIRIRGAGWIAVMLLLLQTIIHRWHTISVTIASIPWIVCQCLESIKQALSKLLFWPLLLIYCAQQPLLPRNPSNIMPRSS